MTKIRTLEQLQQILDEELGWRKKELVVIKSFVTSRSVSDEIVSCHIRSGIALIYAHWEGFVKAAGNAYLRYIATQRLTYLDLTNNFIAMATKRLLNEARESNKVAIYTKVADFFISSLTDRCNLPVEIETKSNLSSEVFKEIMQVLGLDYREYETKAKLIDETLLNNRNQIAHGKFLLVDVEEFVNLHRTMIDLMDLFANQISNAASTQAYRRTSS